MNTTALAAAIADHWDTGIVAQLVDYVRIPAKSPHFDPDWQQNGHIERVTRLAHAWVGDQPVRGLEVEIVRLPGRTPLLFFEVPGGETAGERRCCSTAIWTSNRKWRDGAKASVPGRRSSSREGCMAEAVQTTAMPCSPR